MARPVEDVPADGVHGQYSDEEADEDGGATGQSVRNPLDDEARKAAKRNETNDTTPIMNIGKSTY